MGLDNIPHIYPCLKAGTAVQVTKQGSNGGVILDEDGEPLRVIDCKETQNRDGCPWKREFDKTQGLSGHPTYGMLGTDCWYRGKWGNYLLEVVGLRQEDPYDDTMSFYGELNDRNQKSAEECLELARAIELKMAKRSWTSPDGENIDEDLAYAAWWLRFVATHAGGSDCWF